MITENNKLIAEFMNLGKTEMFFNLKNGRYVKKENEDCDINQVQLYLKNNKPIVNLYYHSDWNWLMEVVEKIKNIVSLIEIPYTNELIAGLITVNKEAVYNACVEFIQWYNKQNK